MQFFIDNYTQRTILALSKLKLGSVFQQIFTYYVTNLKYYANLQQLSDKFTLKIGIQNYIGKLNSGTSYGGKI